MAAFVIIILSVVYMAALIIRQSEQERLVYGEDHPKVKARQSLWWKCKVAFWLWLAYHVSVSVWG